MKGMISEATDLGSHMEYTIETALGPLFAIDPNIDAPSSVGSDTWVKFKPSGVALVGNSNAV